MPELHWWSPSPIKIYNLIPYLICKILDICEYLTHFETWWRNGWGLTESNCPNQYCLFHLICRNIKSIICFDCYGSFICWHLNVAGEELHLRHPVQEPRTCPPRHPSRAGRLKLKSCSFESNSLMQFFCSSAVFLFHCHCAQFLHPRVQNTSNIQNVL